MLHEHSTPVREDDAASIVSREYGLVGALQRLGGERDDNFLLTVSSSERYLVKVAHPRESVGVTNLQSSLLVFLEQHSPELSVQRVVRSREGIVDLEVNDGPLEGRTVRVTTFLEGTVMRSVAPSSELRRDVGVTTAALSRALAPFEHAAAHRRLLWDIQRAADLGPLIEELPASEEPRTLLDELDHFERDVAPQCEGLRSQVIHNDLSTDNLLVTEDGRRVAGVLDFGDVVHAPAVNELAVAVSYQLPGGSDLIDAACDVVRGYHSELPLTDQELSVLAGLVKIRVVTWVTIPAWRSRRIPGNDTYVLRNAERSRALFGALREIPDEYFAQRLRDACHEEA